MDNNSIDNTADVARKGARVVTEKVQGISRSRNTGAKCANGDVLVFVDADVLIPDSLARNLLGDERSDLRGWWGGR